MSKEVAGVQRQVKDGGLTPLKNHNYQCIDYVSVSAFVEQWQLDTNTFHLPFGDMTITLDNVR